MPKIKDIFRFTVGRNHKERKYSKVRKPIMLLEDGTPIYPMTAAEGRKLGAMIAEGFAAGIEKASNNTKFFGHEIYIDAAVKSEINSDSLDMVRYSFMNNEGEI
ncbi:hypothetical protein [Bacillus cereus]|uniref:hypothetical protein n=1 Tax=Bacillus cereus TaxID=1396 RepID=UPI0024BDD04B|nr:hypothetical protein [Bacillus cereus]